MDFSKRTGANRYAFSYLYVMKHYGIGLLFAVFCAISAFAGEPVPRLRVGSSSGIFGPVGNWTYETFAEAKKAGIDAINQRVEALPGQGDDRR